MDLFLSESQSSDSAPSKDDKPQEYRRRGRKVKIRRTAELVPSHIPEDTGESRCSNRGKQQKLSFLPKIDLVEDVSAPSRTLQSRKAKPDNQPSSTFKVRRSILKGKRFPSTKKITKPVVTRSSGRSVIKKLQLSASSSVSADMQNILVESKENTPKLILKDLYINVTPLEKTNLLNESLKRQLVFHNEGNTLPSINKGNRIGSISKKQLNADKENVYSLSNINSKTTSPLKWTKRIQSRNIIPGIIRPCIVLLERIPQDVMNMLLTRTSGTLIKNDSLDSSQHTKLDVSLNKSTCSSSLASNLSKSDTDSFSANFLPLNQSDISNSSRKQSTGRKSACQPRWPFSPNNSSSPAKSDNQKYSGSGLLYQEASSNPYSAMHMISTSATELKDSNTTYKLESDVFEVSGELSKWDVSGLSSSSSNHSHQMLENTNVSLNFDDGLKNAVETSILPTEILNTSCDVEQSDLSPILVDAQRNSPKKLYSYCSLANKPPMKKRKTGSCGVTKGLLSLQSSLLTGNQSQKQSEFLSKSKGSMNNSTCNYPNNEENETHSISDELNSEVEESSTCFSNVTLRKRGNISSDYVIDIDSTSPPWDSDSGECFVVDETFTKDKDSTSSSMEQMKSTYKNIQHFESSNQEMSDIKTPGRKVKFSNVVMDDQDTLNVRTPKTVLKQKRNGKPLSKGCRVTFNDLSVIIVNSSPEQTPKVTFIPTNFSKGNEDSRSDSDQGFTSIQTNTLHPFCLNAASLVLPASSTPKHKVNNIDQKQKSFETPKRTTRAQTSVRASNSLPKVIKTPGPGRTPIHLRVTRLHQKSLQSQLLETQVSNSSKVSCTPLQLRPSLRENRASSTYKGEGVSRKTSLAAIKKSHTFKKTKMPDFSSIHKRMFEKMPNVEEYSKRKSERAKLLFADEKSSQTKLSKKRNSILTNAKTTSSKKHPNERVKTISETKLNSTKIKRMEKAGYNRFGFKVTQSNPVPRKEEMKSVINKIRPPKATTAENRTELKGVRSNRRFELLMQLRQAK